jgi:hypothetical protein
LVLVLPEDQPGYHRRPRAPRRVGVLVRSRVISRLRVARPGEIDYPDVPRPRTRGECPPHPCPWVSCRYHLYLDTTEAGGVKVNFPDKEPDEMGETCALNVADQGDHTLEEVGALLNLTRERVRQIEVIGLEKIKEGMAPWQE